MLVVMWALFAVFGSRGRDVLGYGLAGEEHIASLLTAGLTSSHVAGMVYSSLAVLVFAVPAEVLLTTRCFAVAAIASHAVAVPTGAVAAIIVERAGFNQWGGDLVSETYLSPAAWIFGSLAFTTSSMGVMWRRRVRLVLIALTATLVFYDGSLTAVVAFSAVLIGCAAGTWLSALRSTAGAPRFVNLAYSSPCFLRRCRWGRCSLLSTPRPTGRLRTSAN